jgi:hypothetical protein
MKLLLTTVFLLGLVGTAFAQANTALSNLASPTAVNQSLTPGTTNTRDLGTSTLAWKNIYLRGDLYMDGGRFLSNHPGGGAYNVFVGMQSAQALTTGKYNSALGYQTLYKNNTGFSNQAFGAYALYTNISGYSNVAIGTRALYSNTTGSWNIAIGDSALYKNGNNATQPHHARYNTAVGTKALYANTTGFLNTAQGVNALLNNTSGYSNTAIGSESLFSNSSGQLNTAIGIKALYYNTTGTFNTASGVSALNSNTNGYYNTASGFDVLYNNTTGNNNTADGSFALYNNKTGSDNTALGFNALSSTTVAHYNTAVGSYAGTSYENGYNNVFVGANTDVNGSGYYNVIAIGQGTKGTASSQVTIGNPATTSYRAYAVWSNISDGRYKKNIQGNVPGLEFINKLRPVTYNLDASGLDAFFEKGRTTPLQLSTEVEAVRDKALKEKEARVQTGFVAQEVEQAAKQVGYAFSGVYKPANDKDVYGLSYAEFVVPLVKAVQEIDSTNRVKDERIATLESQVAELRQMMADLRNGGTNAVITSAHLEQNMPNPVSGTTTIRYRVPDYSTSAVLRLTNSKGQVVRTISLSNRGTGQVNLNTQGLASGTYNYTLYLDGKATDTKQLVIAR